MGPRPREEQACGPLGAHASLPAPGHAITVDGSFHGGCICPSLISLADGLFICLSIVLWVPCSHFPVLSVEECVPGFNIRPYDGSFQIHLPSLP